ncbi:BTAD domain-containing putative transcriptional regulator [Actinomadura syzygii]|uniref:Bacterial transcriptional activator domain-containing protein n=1 Tax=Actinomadura syzygii TaxID=1427538 RepID=A0A5D0TT60_9ACTN|nr:BTAD domain-containing putative transcriptional regulator [Actinomadura syzygii]TYC08630.1 hypothetical protein FXF65_37700 [Actinomadura syzygii]
MEISILGRLVLRDDHGNAVVQTYGGPHLVPALICILALKDGAWSGPELKTLLWEHDRDLTSSWTSLTRRARLVLPDRRLETERGKVPPHYRLKRLRGDVFDVADFRTAMAHATRSHKAGDLRAAANSYGAALRLWRSDGSEPLLPDFPETYAMRQNEHYVDLLREYQSATEGYAETRLELGEHSVELADCLHGLITRQPGNTRLHLLRMIILYRLGRKGEALRAHHEAQAMFDHHFEAAPPPVLDHVREQIARDDPRLWTTREYRAWTTPAATGASNNRPPPHR